jgi:hypothetical protein
MKKSLLAISLANVALGKEFAIFGVKGPNTDVNGKSKIQATGLNVDPNPVLTETSEIDFDDDYADDDDDVDASATLDPTLDPSASASDDYCKFGRDENDLCKCNPDCIMKYDYTFDPEISSGSVCQQNGDCINICISPETWNPTNGICDKNGIHPCSEDCTKGCNLLTGLCANDHDGDSVVDWIENFVDNTNFDNECSFSLSSYGFDVSQTSSLWNRTDCDDDGYENDIETINHYDPLDACDNPLKSASNQCLYTSYDWGERINCKGMVDKQSIDDFLQVELSMDDKDLQVFGSSCTEEGWRTIVDDKISKPHFKISANDVALWIKNIHFIGSERPLIPLIEGTGEETMLLLTRVEMEQFNMVLLEDHKSIIAIESLLYHTISEVVIHDNQARFMYIHNVGGETLHITSGIKRSIFRNNGYSSGVITADSNTDLTPEQKNSLTDNDLEVALEDLTRYKCSKGYGGVIFIGKVNSHYRIHSDNYFQNNTATQGGVLYVESAKKNNYTIFVGGFYDNNVAIYGGVVYTDILTTTNIELKGTFYNNQAEAGGVLCVNGFLPSITNSDVYSIRSNEAVFVENSALNQQNSDLGKGAVVYIASKILDSRQINIQMAGEVSENNAIEGIVYIKVGGKITSDISLNYENNSVQNHISFFHGKKTSELTFSGRYQSNTAESKNSGIYAENVHTLSLIDFVAVNNNASTEAGVIQGYGIGSLILNEAHFIGNAFDSPTFQLNHGVSIHLSNRGNLNFPNKPTVMHTGGRVSFENSTNGDNIVVLLGALQGNTLPSVYDEFLYYHNGYDFNGVLNSPKGYDVKYIKLLGQLIQMPN